MNPEQNLKKAKIETPEQPISKWDEKIVVFNNEHTLVNKFLEQLKRTNITPSFGIIDLFLEHYWFFEGDVLRRGDVEEDSSYIQPIPYILIKQKDKYFCYQRLSGGGEERLHNMFSLGVGGHMNHEISGKHTPFKEVILENSARELSEEIGIYDETGNEIEDYKEYLDRFKYTLEYVGYTDKTEVDKVHLALYYILNLDEDYFIKVKETDILKGSFKTIEEIKNLQSNNQLENWSKMIVDKL